MSHNTYMSLFNTVLDLYNKNDINQNEKIIFKEYIFRENKKLLPIKKEIENGVSDEIIKSNILSFIISEIRDKKEENPIQNNNQSKNFTKLQRFKNVKTEGKLDIQNKRKNKNKSKKKIELKSDALDEIRDVVPNSKIEDSKKLSFNSYSNEANEEVLTRFYSEIDEIQKKLINGNKIIVPNFNKLRSLNEKIKYLLLQDHSKFIEEKMANNFVTDIIQFIKQIKENFENFQYSFVNLLTDRLSYFNIFTFMKKIVKFLIDCDEFTFFTKNDNYWVIYDSYQDKRKMIDGIYNDKIENIMNKINSDIIIEIDVDEDNILNTLINNHKYHKLYIMKINYNNQSYLFSFNWAKNNLHKRFIEILFQKINGKDLYKLIVLLSKLIIKSMSTFYDGDYMLKIKIIIKFRFYSLEDILEDIYEVKEQFMAYMKSIISDRIIYLLQDYLKASVVVQKNNFEFSSKKKNLTIIEQGQLSPKFPSKSKKSKFDIKKSTIIDVSSKNIQISETNQMKNYEYYEFPTMNCKFYFKSEVNEIIKLSLNEISKEVIKFSKYLNNEIQKSLYYRYFFIEEKIFMEFDTHGYLRFINQPFEEKFLFDNKIILNHQKNDEKYLFNQIFENNQPLKAIVAELMKYNNLQGAKNDTIYNNVFYEVLVNFDHKEKIKNVYIIIDQHLNTERRKKKRQTSLTTIQNNDDSTPLSKKKNLKDLFQKKVKSIKSFVANNSLKRIMSLLKSKSKNDTYVQEFLPYNLKGKSFGDDDQSKLSSPRDDQPDLEIIICDENKNDILKFRSFTKSTKKNNGMGNLLYSADILRTEMLFKKEDKDNILNTLDFNILAESGDPFEAQRFVWRMMINDDFLNEFSIPINTFCQFLDCLKTKYNKRKNPFHNFDHGVSVMQCCYYFCNHTSAKEYFNNIEKFSLIFSGLCHDVSHTGHNNLFEMNCLSKLALRYHDKSVLEQHHIATTFKILLNENFNIFCNVSVETVKEIRKFMISNILSTDMKEHFTILENFETRLKELSDYKLSFMKNENDKKLLLGILIHSADFNGTVKEFSISKLWSERVNTEFFKQYKEEGLLGITQTPYMKDLDRNDIMAKAEMGFIKVIVQPLWSLLNRFLNHDLNDYIKNLITNAESWEKIYNENGMDKEMISFLSLLLKEEKEDPASEDSSVDINIKRSKSLLSSLKQKFREKRDIEKTNSLQDK